MANRQYLEEKLTQENELVSEQLTTPIAHVHKSKGGFFSVFDQPHFVD